MYLFQICESPEPAAEPAAEPETSPPSTTKPSTKNSGMELVQFLLQLLGGGGAASVFYSCYWVFRTKIQPPTPPNSTPQGDNHRVETAETLV